MTARCTCGAFLLPQRIIGRYATIPDRHVDGSVHRLDSPCYIADPYVAARHGVAAPQGFDAVPTGTTGLWELRRDGEVVGSILLRGIALPRQHVDKMVAALNNEPPAGWPGWTVQEAPPVDVEAAAGTTSETKLSWRHNPDDKDTAQ